MDCNLRGSSDLKNHWIQSIAIWNNYFLISQTDLLIPELCKELYYSGIISNGGNFKSAVVLLPTNSQIPAW